MEIIAYERLKDCLSDAIRIQDGEHLLVRRPFRWLLDNHVINNCYEMFDVETALKMSGTEIVESFGPHIHVVKKISEPTDE